MRRTVLPETLDGLAADDPAAMRSRINLQRVHRAMGTRTIVARALRSLAIDPQHPRPLRVLELGAGDGTLMLRVASQLAPFWPPVALTLLDRQALTHPRTIDTYAALGWQATSLITDVSQWVSEPSGETNPSTRPWDLIVANLFLHHFEGAELTALLGACARRSTAFVACEPRRAWAALAGSHLVGALGANAVTREDAVLSVHAGFQGRELARLWPNSPEVWTLTEYAAGLFSHCFVAQRARGH